MKSTRATTLIEIIFYFALVGIFLTAAMSFALQIAQSYGASQTQNELQTNIDFIAERLTISLQQATGVDSADSLFDVDAGRLSLTMTEAPSPVIFYVSNGDFFVQEGAATPVELNTNAVQVDQVRFHLSTYDKAPDYVTIDGVLSLVGAESSAYLQTRSFHLFMSLKNF
jgi:hypothetical protein